MSALGSAKRYLTPILVVVVMCVPVHAFAGTVFQSNKIFGPTNGLVGYWTFNGPDINWNTNTVVDRSGNGNTGTLVNMATRTSPTAGKLGQGLNFLPSPVVDYMNAGSASSLNNLNSLTASAWVNANDLSGNKRIFQKSQSPIGTQGWYIVIRSSYIGFGAGSTGTLLSASGPTTFSKGWHHVVVTWDGGLNASGVKFYIDGIPLPTTGINGSGSRDDDSSLDLTVGGYTSQSSNYHFDGILDDVRIYNRILTSSEIAQLANVGQLKIGVPPAVSPGSGLVGWWTFNGPDINWNTNTVVDRSGNGNTGTLVNMATRTSPTAGKLGQGLLFDYPKYLNMGITVPKQVSVNDLPQKTISFWMKSNSAGGGGGAGIVIDKGIWEVSYWGGFFRFKHEFSSATASWKFTTSPILGKWHHIAVAYNRSSASNAPAFYVDGASSPLTVDTAPVGTAWNEAAYDISMGNNSALSRQFDGILDDVRIYNRILSPQEIAQLAGVQQVRTNYFFCGISTVKDNDFNIYNTVKIGSQCWTKQNMRVGTSINGATSQTNNGIIEKYCFVGSDNYCTDNHPNHPDGGLYQWNEAMQYSSTPGTRGICPLGWHIPTHDQFTTLERAVCTSVTCATDFPYDTSTTGSRGTDEGTKLKPNGNSLWEGNLAGFGDGSGAWGSRSSSGYYWTSTEAAPNAWLRRVYAVSSIIERSKISKNYGYSVRCVKD